MIRSLLAVVLLCVRDSEVDIGGLAEELAERVVLRGAIRLGIVALAEDD